MELVSVILDIPTQALDAPYLYLVPDEAADDLPVEVGCAVVVPLGPRRVVGFVVDRFACEPSEIPGGLDPAKLRYVERAVSSPYFDEEGAACAQWLSERYIAPLSACVRLFMPPGGVPRMMRARDGRWRLVEPKVGEVDDRWVVLGPRAAQFEPRKNAVKQMQIMEALSRGELRAAELTANLGNVSSTLKALEKKGAIAIEHRRRLRGVMGPPSQAARFQCRPDRDASDAATAGPLVGETSGGRSGGRLSPKSAASGGRDGLSDGGAVRYASAFLPTAPPDLTPDQRWAVRAIEQARESGGGVVLVDGVTGSGKTEVYLQAIESVIRAGGTACVLVPEIALTPQTVARFRGRFGEMVAVMHSRMSDGERYDQWDFIRSGAARVVVGARSALFTPLRDIGLIVIDEEHESTYKQDSAPRYHARDVAIWMARRSGAVVVLGSATPSIESLHAAGRDSSWVQVGLPTRANGRPLPDVTVIDMAREFGSGSRSMFSRQLATALEDELAARRKAVLLLNQRGFAKFVLCRDCGFVPECPSCSTSLTYHERGRKLVCHHCGYRVAMMPACPACGSPYLRKFGAGTQRVEDELRLLIDGFARVDGPVPVIRMDADTTSGKGAHQRLLDQFASAEVAVLLGTQMIAKGLDFEDVTLVGVINADTQLHLPDYRAAERTFDLIEQVAGRAGRGKLDGRVLVQTYQAHSPAIRAAAAYDRQAFLADELPKREALGYPPFSRLADVLVWGADEDAVREAACKLREDLAVQVRDFAQGAGWSVLAASPCVLGKLRGVYRWHILVKAPPDADVSEVLLPLFRARKPQLGVNAAVDVDPMGLL